MAKYSVVDGQGEVVDFDQGELDLALEKFVQGAALSSKDCQILSSSVGKKTVEFPDPTPMAPPVGFTRRPPLHQLIREMVQRELSQSAEHAGMETAEEADDFDVGDDYDPDSPFEHDFEPRVVPSASDQVAELEAVIARERAAVDAPRRLRELQEELQELRSGGRGGEAPRRTTTERRSKRRDSISEDPSSDTSRSEDED